MNQERNTVCLFTGHRELPASQEKLRLRTRRQMVDLISHGVCTFLSGGARGFDLLGASLTIALREEYPQVRLVMVLPCRGQDRSWREQDRRYFAWVLEQADEIICLSDFYYRGCMHRRNNYMVEHGGHCIAYCNRDSGGSYYTVSRAKKHGLAVYNMADTGPWASQMIWEEYLG